MDASSLLLSLPSSISGAVDFGQRFHYAREFQLESSDAATQLRFLTRQLENWRRCVGITEGDELQDVHDEALDDSEILELVGDDLDSIRKHTQNLKKRLSKLGVERSPGPRASGEPGSQLLPKRDAGRPKSPIPSLKGVSWGYGRDKLVWGELDRVAQAVGHLYELVPPKVLPLEDDAEKRKEEDRRAQTREILEWLRAPQIDQQYDTHINARLDGTCDWIFDHQAYRAWTSELDNVGRPKLLWIHGPAGSGKTVLSAAIIRERTKVLEQGQSILYCFCSSFAQANATFEDVIRIWIWQLIHQNHSVVEPIWNEYMNSSNIERGTVASQTEVWKIWKDLLSESVGCTVVIDGFDEFDRSYRVQSKFLQRIKQMAAQTTTNVLITSRNEEDIQHALSPRPRGTSEIFMLECLVTKELVRGDLDLLASELINDVLHSKSDEVKKDLASRLAARSDGMFLWIKQQNMGQLRPGKPLKQLRQIVDRMPSGLKETYRKIWDEIERRQRDDKERTLAILRLVAFAFRPLTVAEITEALLVKPDQDSLNLDEWPDAVDEDYIKSEIKGLCGSLIDIRLSGESDVPGLRTLHLAHVSVKEFLVDELCTKTAKEDSETKKLAEHHTELAKLCLRYLTYPEIWHPNLASDQGGVPRSFLDYASAWWERHVLLGDELDGDVSKHLDLMLQPDSSEFYGWRSSRIDSNSNLQPSEKEQLKKAQGNPLVWASQFDLKGSVKRLLSTWPNLIYQREHQGNQTPLHVASGLGSLDIIKLLLEKGAEVDSRSSGKRTPLICAVLGGKRENVSYLLDIGADVNIQDESGRTPLCHACMSGRSDIALFLLERGADPKIADNDRYSPLYGLCRSGDGNATSIIRFIEKGANKTIDLEATDGATCLHACAEFNRFKIASVLLKNGAKASLNARLNGQTPMHIAASRGYQEMLQLLMDQRCDIDVRSSKNLTPLHMAAQRGHTTAVQLLLDNGASIEATNDLGVTPLRQAVRNGHVDTIELLLARGANEKVRDKQGWSPLHSAARGGLLNLVKKLVNSGADPNIVTSEGVTPLHAAASNGRINVMEHLIREGARVQAITVKGNTPLFFAAQNGHVSAVSYLLDQGAELRAKNKEMYEPIHVAASYNHLEVVRLLIDRGANPNVSSTVGWQPLHLAAGRGKSEVAKYLLEHGADPSVDNISGMTPLFCAVENGHSNIVALLLDHGADQSATQYKTGITALHSAVINGHVDTVALLLRRGADISMKAGNSLNILLFAARSGNPEIIESLVGHGADVSAQCKGLTPLAVAVERDHEDAVRMLLKYRADPTWMGSNTRPIIHHAAFKGSTAVFTLLLDAISDFDALMKGPWNLFNDAAHGGEMEILNILLHKRPIEYFKPDYEERTALHLAARGGNLAAFEMLLGMGCDPTAKDARGRNILHYASMGSSAELIEKILQLPCSADLLEQESRFTPLHWAAISGHAQVMAALVAAGLEETIVEAKFPKKASEWTPWSLSKFFKNEKLLSETEFLFKLRGFPQDIAPGKRHYTYYCDSCENDIIGPRFICHECPFLDYCFMCREDAEVLHPGHEFCMIYV